MVESSILPLELIYEHRNYLPSMFLFWPVAIFVVNYSDSTLNNNRIIRVLVGGGVLLVIVGLGWATYARNQVWATENSLWVDTLAKAPNNARPYINLAIDEVRQGAYLEALELYDQSLTKNSPWPSETQAVAFTNMGSIFFRFGQYEKAVKLYRVQ